MNESIGCIKGGRVVRLPPHGRMEAGMFPENVIVSDPNKGALDQITEGAGEHAQ